VNGKGGCTLLVHWNPYGRRMRHATVAHLEAVARAGFPGPVVALNGHGGVPAAARRLNPSAVILHTTFLATRWLPDFSGWRARSAWIGELGCPVLALPQDDFDHSGVLDDWLDDLGVTCVFTSLPTHAEFLYPKTSRRAAVVDVLTGYVDRTLTALPRKSLAQRRFDVVYRATRLPYWFGRLGQLKAAVGDEADAIARRRGLTADISMDADDAITGRAWLCFLQEGRTVVGCESGSSMIDPDGSVQRRTTALLSDTPGLSYEEIVRRVHGEWDAHWFGVVSPRHFEAAAAGSPQVLVEGSYSGVLVAGKHYIPVRRDLSDLDQALMQALDPDLGAELAARTHADLVESGRYDVDRLTEAVQRALPASSGEGGPVPEAPLRAAVFAWNAFAASAAAAGRWRRAVRP
jgi:hypothetical protein